MSLNLRNNITHMHFYFFEFISILEFTRQKSVHKGQLYNVFRSFSSVFNRPFCSSSKLFRVGQNWVVFQLDRHESKSCGDSSNASDQVHPAHHPPSIRPKEINVFSNKSVFRKSIKNKKSKNAVMADKIVLFFYERL